MVRCLPAPGGAGRCPDRPRGHTRDEAEDLLDLVKARPPLPGVLDYLSDAKQLGLKLGVASSSSRDWVEGHLKRLNLVEQFESIHSRDDVRRVKPDPELYLTSVEKLGTSPDRTLAIEDSPNGVTSAKRAGLLCVAVPNQMTKDLPLDHADLRVESLADMPLRALLSTLTQKQRTG